MARFQFLWPQHLSCVTSPNARPRHHRYLIPTTPLPAPINFHSRFMRRTRNRAVTLGFVVFGPQPTLPPRVRECTAPAAAAAYPHHTTTCTHHLPQPFHTAHPKPSRLARFCGFWPHPTLRLAFANAQPYHHQQATRTTPLPSPVTLCHCFARRTGNRANALGFVVFGS